MIFDTFVDAISALSAITARAQTLPISALGTILMSQSIDRNCGEPELGLKLPVN
jgi:hypothetical protein